MTDAASVPTRLRREWVAVATGASVLLVSGAAALSFVVDAPTLAAATLPATPGLSVSTVLAGLPVPLRWLVPTAAVAAYELWFCFRYLRLNRPEASAAGRSPHRRLGVPNLVTLARGGLFAAVAGFVALAPRAEIAWIPAILYGFGCALDAVDGALARRLDRRTVLGAKLDMAIDTTGFLLAPVVAVLWGQLPIWYLSLSVARYLFKFGRGLRRRRGKSVYDLPDSLVRRPLAGIQMAFITLALSPLFDLGAIRPLAAVVLAPSLAVFARDYLVVSGRIARSRR
ncbi:CDP-alcohol phosphatidyltransferase family protein [Halobellus salinisoli]|uniref:CDP-alcohol phosphatidyltransferase family protein n=1 Tax=Halobellus salinisoli TaxID=3108500 RepID=UPI00300BC225